MTNLNTFHIDLPAVAVSAGEARNMVAGSARQLHCMSDSDIEDLCVAVGEAFANVVLHSSSPGDGPVTLRVERREDRLAVTMDYHSEPFNTDPTVPRPCDMAGGGYGLFIMRALTDLVDFNFRDGTAHLLMEKMCSVSGGRSDTLTIN